MEKYGKYDYLVKPDIEITRETEGEIIGYCFKDVYNNPVMTIVVSDRILARNGNYYCMVIYEKGQLPLFVCSWEIAKGLQESNPSAQFVLMHELGHCVMRGSNSFRKSKKKDKHSIENVNYSATSCRASCIIHYCSTATQRLTAESYTVSAGVRFGRFPAYHSIFEVTHSLEYASPHF